MIPIMVAESKMHRIECILRSLDSSFRLNEKKIQATSFQQNIDLKATQNSPLSVALIHPLASGSQSLWTIYIIWGVSGCIARI